MKEWTIENKKEFKIKEEEKMDLEHGIKQKEWEHKEISLAHSDS